MAYLRDVDAAPIHRAEESMAVESSTATIAVHPELLDELWSECDAGEWGLDRAEFGRIVLLVAMAQNCGAGPGATASRQQQAAFFGSVKLADLVLAKACAVGNERAWEHFMAQYGQLLTRAAIAISGSDSVGRDLADAFYAELYGLNVRDGVRKSPLDSYRGRGSLIGWLRTTLAQRFVDHYRRTFREQRLDEQIHDAAVKEVETGQQEMVLTNLRAALKTALREQRAEERFLLAAYYIDEKTLAEIARVLHVHEATISRRLRRATDAVRKHLLRNLEKQGMSRRSAEEALGTDPRDVDLRMDLKKLLQYPAEESFQEQEIPKNETTAGETMASGVVSERGEPLGKNSTG